MMRMHYQRMVAIIVIRMRSDQNEDNKNKIVHPEEVMAMNVLTK